MKPRPSGCCHESHVELPALTDRLRKQSLKITGPRQSILEVMRDHPRPLLIKEIHAQMGKGDCDLVTVYRSMSTLQKMGIVRKVDFGKGGSRFELITDEGAAHHHHLVCETCQAVLQLDDCLLHDVERRIEKASGFRMVTHRLEFFGICPDCQAGKKAASPRR